MGCTSSKRIEASVVTGVYRPTLDFDIHNIEEPWRTTDKDDHQGEGDEDEDDHEMKKLALSPIALEKLNKSLEADEEAPPPTWDQVKKDLEFIKPALQPATRILDAPPQPKPTSPVSVVPMKKVKRKSFSFHTLEELDTRKPSFNQKTDSDGPGLRKVESVDNFNKLNSVKAGLKKTSSIKLGTDSRPGSTQLLAGVNSEGYKPVRENIFLLKDRMERKKEGKEPGFLKRDPLSYYPELIPPGGANLVVVYTTSLGGVRRTYEDCYKVRSILELHRVVFDERDVSLHSEFLSELKELVGEGVLVPRMFVKGRYIGGVDEVVNLNETGRLRRIWNWIGVERGSGRQGCEGCGGARFVPCLDCGGSCKVVVMVEGKTQKQRCPECNENGLVHCPACL